jgi:hypothetical protein
VNGFPVPVSTPLRHPSWHAGVFTVDPVPPLRWIRLDPHLRGRVTPTTLARLRAAGLCVHRVGAAAYVHDAERRHRWILAVVPHGDGGAVPAFGARLEDHHRWLRRRGGAPLPRERARQERYATAFAAADPALPWWKRGQDA